jgi:diaminopimelate decarboxylase
MAERKSAEVVPAPIDPVATGHSSPGRSALGRHVLDPIEGSAVYPIGSRVNERGHLEIAGCDVLELAAEFGTPAYIYAEDDMRARARATVAAFAERTDSFEVVYASKAFPCTAALRIFAEEGLSCDVASGGELYLALQAGFDPARIYMHGNNKTEAELEQALAAGIGHVIVDSFDEIDRLERVAAGRPQRVLLRVTPGIHPDTHHKIATGQEDSKFGIPLATLPRAVERCAAAGLDLVGLHAHLGSQVFDLDVYDTLADVMTAAGDYPVVNMGGGFAVAYTRDQRPPPAAAYAEAMLERLPDGIKVLCEPGRSLVANAGVSAYTVGTVKGVPRVRTYVSVDGGMADNIRPMLYDAVYEAEIADRIGDSTPCRLVGMHCESGDILIKEAALEDPRVGDVLVTPATGAYGYAMASNYNGVPRPPVVFCRDGEARVVVRRETYEDLTSRDV